MYFAEIISKLQNFWNNQGCVVLQPFDMEVGAGTSHPATMLRCLDENDWKAVYVQPSRRPTDGRYAENPNRNQHYYQMQVLLKPTPNNIQDLCIESFRELGLRKEVHDFRFVEDDWENPSIGASGLGWEVWCDGMEILQFTFMQKMGGITLKKVSAELTYGLERLAMYLQNVNSIWDIKWNDRGVTYSDVFERSEVEYCKYNFEYADTSKLFTLFELYESECRALAEKGLAHPAADQCLKASHTFNLLEARGVISVSERTNYIARIRALAMLSAHAYLAK
jgi:glycyl-tRNA synthetase alpha chain